MNYDDMTIKELETLNTQLSNERAAIKKQQLEINRILSQRYEDARRGYDMLFSDDQAMNVNKAGSGSGAPKDGE